MHTCTHEDRIYYSSSAVRLAVFIPPIILETGQQRSLQMLQTLNYLNNISNQHYRKYGQEINENKYKTA
jgi:hypothetical protein